MEVREVAWYRKQLRRRAKIKNIMRICIWMLLLSLGCFGVVCGFAGEVSAKGIVRPVLFAPENLLIKDVSQDRFTDVEVEKVEEVDEMVATREEPTEILDVDRKPLIVLDAGHGGMDEGCSNATVEEKNLNLTLALKVKERLEALDFRVLLTREEDKKVSLEERVLLANDAKADAFVSIHQNSSEDKTACGVETWYYAEDENNKRLAQLMQQYTVLNTNSRDRGCVEADNLYVIRECEMPSCLVETSFLSNNEECTRMQEEGYLDKIAKGIAEAIEIYFYPKTMYLTFDDGPVADNTEQVLDILKEKNIKATFFLIGKNVERYPDLVKRMVEEGHTIGIHCYRHDYKDIYSDADSYLEDFDKARAAIYEVTGEDVKLFRFPGGSINSYNKAVYKEIIETMTEQGYVYFDWNASLEDAVKNPEKEKILQNAKESTLGRKKVVMLAHDMVDETVECLEELIEQFPEYEMKALDETVVPVRF